MDDRAKILAALPESSTPPTSVAGFTSAPAGRTDLWSWFEDSLLEVGGAFPSLDGLAELRGRSAWFDDDARALAASAGCREAADPWEAAIGFTTAVLAVAETGSVLLAASPGRRRLTSLAPEVHVAFVQEGAIVATLDEAIARLEDRTCVLVTGASRTADIESVLVRGVHGPGELWVVRV